PELCLVDHRHRLLLHRRPDPARRAQRLLDAERADLAEEHREGLVARPFPLRPDRCGSATHPADASPSLPAWAASAGGTPAPADSPAPDEYPPWPACARG